MSDQVIVTCVENGSGAVANAKGDIDGVAKTARASCTMGTQWAVKRAAMKLLGGSDKDVKAERIEDNHDLPRRTVWRVTR